MPRLSLAELEARCQKPDFRTSGNWMARRVSRPLALRVTWIVAPWRISANTVTTLALLVALAAAGSFAWGGPLTWLVGAALLQLWYLLDHVDGQVARLRGTSSLDGIQLDYLMHHIVNLIIPCALGWGVWRSTGVDHWLLAGFAFAVGTLVLGLANDTRYKAFIARLNEVNGPLLVQAQPPQHSAQNVDRVVDTIAWRFARRGVHLARKLCEVHVAMNFITAVAISRALTDSLLSTEIYLASMAPLAVITSIATVTRDVRRRAAERDFARWFMRQDPSRRLQ